MNTTTTHTIPRPLYERVLKILVVGGFSLLLLYIKAMGGILKLGLEAVKKMPAGRKRANHP